ncbi:MAG: phenylacetic acid degradation operon negative regulatory protein PaaX [Herbaspirillum sp.]
MIDHPPRAKSMVMTLFGDTIAPHGGKVWLGSLIELLAPFGISDRLVRTSVFRLAEEDWLNARREGRRSEYALNPKATHRFRRAYQRIYSPSYRPWNGKWSIAFSLPGAITAQQRSNLRKELLWEGFGMIAPSVFCHPCADPATLDEVLVRVGAKKKMLICDAEDSSLVGIKPLGDLIEECWQLDTIAADYQSFIECFAPLKKLISSKRELPPKQAFAIRVLLIHGFRRVQLHDPQLPLELLPTNWPGETAYELCRSIYRSVQRDAERHVEAVLLQEMEAVPKAATYFYQRFGGLD